MAASRPALLLDLSQNALGDESAEAICNALYHDKWLLGLNLSQNRISRKGISLLVDTLTQSNRTLAILVVANMKDPVDHVNLRQLDALMHERKRFLQHLAVESREKRLALCSLLLEWNVERELVLEICQSTAPPRSGKLKQRSSSSIASSSSSCSSPADSSSRPWDFQSGIHTATRAASSNQELEFDGHDDGGGDNQREIIHHGPFGVEAQHRLRDARKSDVSRSPQRVMQHLHQQQSHDTRAVTTSHMAHLQTVRKLLGCFMTYQRCSLMYVSVCMHGQKIKLLTERMSAMEAEQRQARSYMNKLEVSTSKVKKHMQISMDAAHINPIGRTKYKCKWYLAPACCRTKTSTSAASSKPQRQRRPQQRPAFRPSKNASSPA